MPCQLRFVILKSIPLKGKIMSKQIQVTYELKVLDGKAEELRRIAKEMVAFNRQGEPGTIVYNVYMNEEETKFTFLETFAESDSGLFHAARFAKGSFISQVLERTDGGRLCLYGDVSKEFRSWGVEAGFEIEYFDYIDGYVR